MENYDTDHRFDQMKKLTLLLFLTVIVFLAKAQIGVPEIRNFSSIEYKGGTQNWKIDQDSKGLMYFANNEGLSSYDGKHWKLYPLPHKTIVRSIAVMPDGKIYVGGQDEIGYFFPDLNGCLKYHSLKDLIPIANRQLQDVWDIVSQNNDVFFRTNKQIMHLKDGLFDVYKSNSSWRFLGIAKGEVYAQDAAEGLFIYKNDTWENILPASDLTNITIKSILPYHKDTFLVATYKNGVFILNGNQLSHSKNFNQAFFQKNRVSGAINISNGWYALSTVSSGCVIVNKTGNIVQRFTHRDGLQKDNIRCVFVDKNQNLWLGLDDGIDFIAFNNAIKYIYPDSDKQRSSYNTQILDNELYVGTSNGLFVSKLTTTQGDLSFSTNPFSEIQNTKGQIWNLNIINKQLLVAHEEGAFVVKNDQATVLYKPLGTWMFQSLFSYSPTTKIVAGTYKGLQFLNSESNKFVPEKASFGANESLRFIVYDDNKNFVWASHPYRGIYKFALNDKKDQVIRTTIYTEKDGLPSALGNYIVKIKNRIVVATIGGLYEFDEKNQKFIYSRTFAPIFGKMVIEYLKEDSYGNIWFVTGKKVGVVDFSRKRGARDFDIIYFPELTSKLVAGFDNIYPFNNQNIFIGANEGLIHLNYQNYLKSIRPLSINLALVKTIGKSDSTLFGGYFLANGRVAQAQGKEQIFELPSNFNSFHFEYASPFFDQQSSIEFSYKLQGFDDGWSIWGSKAEKDYTNLPSGTYVFKVKSINNLGNQSATALYKFTIAPAWYQSWLFYITCLLLLIIFIYLIIHRQKSKYLKEQEYLKKVHLLEIEQSEKEIVKLRNEKLEADVNFKNKQLATRTMHLMQRGKLLSRIKEELSSINKADHLRESPQGFNKLLALIKDAERTDNDWEHFSVHFDHVHANFLSKLKEKIPSLSANDLKLCAYLKMNLTSKEIAQLMSVTVRAVEVSRYRLRKKLDVSADINLFDYLLEITGN